MKLSGRALEVNGAFLLLVALLVSLQLYLHHAQKRLLAGGVGEVEVEEEELRLPRGLPDANLQDDTDGVVTDALVADVPMVPNIRKSFPKRKAHYYRRLKKAKAKKQKNKKNKKIKKAEEGKKKSEVKEGMVNRNSVKGKAKKAKLKKEVFDQISEIV